MEISSASIKRVFSQFRYVKEQIQESGLEDNIESRVWERVNKSVGNQPLVPKIDSMLGITFEEEVYEVDDGDDEAPNDKTIETEGGGEGWSQAGLLE